MFHVPSRRHNRLHVLKSSTALFSSMLVVTGLTTNISASAQDLPQGGSVAAGSATISQTAPNAMVINQTSATAVTNWQSFSIGQGNSVAVVQPSTSSAMLARVTGGTTSTIAGSLSATGQFMLVNPNGISITATGTVNAGGGFVATTLGISDDDFLSGKRSFKGNGASASVSNDGAITVGPGGYAALIGGTVSNAGTISVPMGKVGLGSGEIATLDFSGDGFLQVGVPTSAPGKGALVSNAGKITANGGSVHIKAAQARDAARQAINMSGVIEARSVSGSNGNISLGGSDGEVAVTGKLDVSSASGKGGSVRVTGRQIKLSGATVDASGKTGGGTVRIGGDRQGTGTMPRAAKVTVDQTTIIRADATDQGNGGDVVIWSDSRTDFAGTITARGGANGGNGGEAEVSSKGVLGYSGLTVLTAAKGTTGTLLLDPYNITISNAADTGGFTASADDSVINVSTLQTALASANVTISTGASGSQNGDITIAAPLAWSANLLTLNAAHSIKVASTVTVGGTGALMLNTNVGGGSGGTLDFGLTNSGFTGRIDFTGTPGAQALFVDNAQYSLVYSAADLLNINTANAGDYALAGNLDLASTPYTDAPITSFSGTFEGLGHTISNLSISSATNNANVGLFGTVTGGTVRDIGVVGGSVSGTDTQPSYPNPSGSVGALVGLLTTVSNGTSASVINSYAYTSVSGGTSANVGGLVGSASTHGATTLVANSFATGTVTGGQSAIVGGLVGYNIAYASGAAISGSYATGAVSAGIFGNAGGLVGYNYAFVDNVTITNSHATGVVTGGANATLGGLAGQNASRLGATASITNAYATGTVGSVGATAAGGLVGVNSSAGGYSSLTGVFATGAVSGGYMNGGLVGQSVATSTGTVAVVSIANAYATGAVTGIQYGQAGGLVGTLQSYGSNGTASVTNAYATGVASAPTQFFQTYAGGLIGWTYPQNGGTATVGNSYWDTTSSGLSNGIGRDDSGQQANVTGSTTAAFQTTGMATSLGSGFSGGDGLYPYLTAIFQNGVQAVSGTVYGNAGTNPLASGANGPVTVSVVGANALLGSATTGANGSYYVFGAAGTIANGTQLIAYTTQNGTHGVTNAARIATSAYSGSAPSQTGVDIYEPVKLTIATTSAATLSASGYDLSSTPVVSLGSSLPAFLNDAAPTLVSTNSTGFTIDRTLDLTRSFGVQTTAPGAPLTVANAITVESGSGLGLFAAGALVVNAPITVKGAGSVALAFDQNTSTPLATDLSFAGAPLTFADGSGNALTSAPGNQSLTVNGAAYRLLYSMADIGSINSGLAGGYALARDLDASGRAYTTGVVAGGDSSFNAPATAFSGTFEGLGHIVSNLAISGDANGYIGLVGASSGTIRNIGIVGGSFSGNNHVGALAGWNTGTIVNAYAASAITGGNYVGGLVGDNSGSIGNAFATGAVSGFASVGGLVGMNAGTIANVYATGAVRGTRAVGGFLGTGNGGTISNAYATGAVTASRAAGGLVGQSSSGTIGNSYWDMSTSGTTVAVGEDSNSQSANVTGLTTAQFQTASAATDLGVAFAGDSGLYPYLASFFPNGVQAISGIAYIDAGQTALASGRNGAGLVNVRVGNGATQTASTGVNGYYYAFVPYGSMDTTNGTNVLVYAVADANTGAKDAVAFRTAATGTLTNLDLSGGWRRDTTGLGNLSTLDAAYSAAAAGTSADGMTLANRSIFAVSDFSLDGVLSLTGTFNLSSAGNVTQTAAFSAGTLILQGLGNTFTLTNTGNRFDQFVASGGAMNVYDATNLTIAANATDACNCTVSGVTGDGIRIATAGNLTIASGASVAGDSPVLAAGGAFVNNAGVSAVTANTGRWLVYAAGPTGNTYGGLDSHNTAVWGTSYPTAVTAQGNRYVFARQATLTVTALDAEKSVGETSGFNGYTVSGFESGIAGAFLADAPTGLTGAPVLSSAGAATSAAPGTYDIAVARGSLAWSGNGYGFNFVSGKLAVKGALTPPDGSIVTPPADFVPDPTNAFAPSPSIGSRKGSDPSNTANFSTPGFDSAIVCFPGRACE